MNKWTVLLLGLCIFQCTSREPLKPRDGSIPFVVSFPSRYRGLCVGILASRTVVVTAAICVTNPLAEIRDTRPINVVVGTTYRHPRRGIRVQVTKILVPSLTNLTAHRGYLMDKSTALLLLKRKVPDILTEVPLRPIDIDWKGEEKLSLQEECMTLGWHFFYKGDVIYPVFKFLLQRNMRLQFLNIVKKRLYCEQLTIKYENAMTSLGFHQYIDTGGFICTRDPDRTAQPCHGMYGAPLICRGRAVGMMLAPDAQWSNCTGFSNIIHLFSNTWLRKFMLCASVLFEPDEKYNWEKMKKYVYEDYDVNDGNYVERMYDTISGETSSSDET